MTVFLFLIIAAAIAAVVTTEAVPVSVHRDDERGDAGRTDALADAGANTDGIEYVEDEFPSPLLGAAIVETAHPGFGTMAVARLVASLAASGLVVGLIVVGIAKLIGILLRHFAANS